MNIIIVDDERNARENLRIKMERLPDIKEIKLFEDPMGAISYVKKNNVDVAFLDIEMFEMSGIEMAKRLKDINPKLNVIFVTGHDEHVLEAFRLNASNYILKPASIELIKDALDNLRYPVQQLNPYIWVQTFGCFEIFVGERPLQISRAKVKELLACLVDRRGASVTAAQIAAVLWEDKEYSRSVQKQTQTVISQMMKILREVGIEYIIVKGWNNLAVDISKFECDYYQFLKGDLTAINSYTGEYMNEYSWAEMTAGMLVYRK